MKYKTLCRLLVRLMGVYFLSLAVTSAFVATVQAIPVMTRGGGFGRTDWIAYCVVPGGYLLVGCYLLVGSRRIANLLIPSNRPYCPGCGYDLTGSVGNVCAECGTAFKSIVKSVEPHH
jgi:hypothetical protein